jgi:hypothetical protein
MLDDDRGRKTEEYRIGNLEAAARDEGWSFFSERHISGGAGLDEGDVGVGGFVEVSGWRRHH